MEFYLKETYQIALEIASNTWFGTVLTKSRFKGHYNVTITYMLSSISYAAYFISYEAKSMWHIISKSVVISSVNCSSTISNDPFGRNFQSLFAVYSPDFRII